jgi:MSHA biogenesis protein MshK
VCFAALLLGLLASTTVMAERLTDPTKPWDVPASNAAANAAPPSRAPVLHSTMIAPGRRVAVIDGEIVQEGERMGDLRVVRIETSRVVLRGPQGALTLKLLPTSVKSESRNRTQ